MRIVRQTLACLPPSHVDYGKAAVLVRTSYRFQYRRTHLYVPRPAAEVEATGFGNCKDKALWLAERLGDNSGRFVIGLAYHYSTLNHAWLEWRSGGVTWILYPTLHSAPRQRWQMAPGRFIPLWSYTNDGAWRH